MERITHNATIKSTSANDIHIHAKTWGLARKADGSWSGFDPNLIIADDVWEHVTVADLATMPRPAAMAIRNHLQQVGDLPADDAATIARKAREHDALYNEGGEGYNPHRQSDTLGNDRTPWQKGDDQD